MLKIFGREFVNLDLNVNVKRYESTRTYNLEVSFAYSRYP